MTSPVTPLTFSDRQYRVASGGGGVVVDVPALPADLDALRDALAWRRTELSVGEIHDVDAVLALRALISLDDRLLAARESAGDLALLTLTRDDVVALCGLAADYVTARDVEGYQSLKERDRIARLRAMSGTLMDTCSEFAAAEDEARAKALIA